MLVCVITTPSEKKLPRKTLASRIVELTKEGNLLAAQELAQYEKILSNTEHLAQRYYDKADEVEAAMYNFTRAHSAHGQTPAMAAGITDHKRTVEELLESIHCLPEQNVSNDGGSL